MKTIFCLVLFLMACTKDCAVPPDCQEPDLFQLEKIRYTRNGGGDKIFEVRLEGTSPRKAVVQLFRLDFKDTSHTYTFDESNDSLGMVGLLDSLSKWRYPVKGDYVPPKLPTGTWVEIQAVGKTFNEDVTHVFVRDRLEKLEGLFAKPGTPEKEGEFIIRRKSSLSDSDGYYFQAVRIKDGNAWSVFGVKETGGRFYAAIMSSMPEFDRKVLRGYVVEDSLAGFRKRERVFVTTAVLRDTSGFR
jgi:hypothetical protein